MPMPLGVPRLMRAPLMAFGLVLLGGVETKGLRHEIDVVVDGLGDADDGNADALRWRTSLAMAEAAFMEPSPPMTKRTLTLSRSSASTISEGSQALWTPRAFRRTGKYARRWLASAPSRCGCRRG